MTENTSNNQPSLGEILSRIENALMEFIASQQQVSSQILSRLGSVEADLGAVKADLGAVKADLTVLKLEVGEIKEDAKLRYVDLRERIELNNDRLDVIDRTLRQLAKDLRNPTFPSVNTR